VRHSLTTVGVCGVDGIPSVNWWDYGMADHRGGLCSFLQHELEEQVERWQRAGADQNVICEAFCAVYQQLTPDDKERQKLAQQQRMRAEQQRQEQGE
jgi:hypothetical protein